MGRSTLAIGIALLALALLSLAVPGAGAASGPSGELIAGSEETVLRLHDLPPGYQVGDDSGCGPLIPSSDRGSRERGVKRFYKWIARYWPESCFYQYEQLFEVPKLGPAPPLVEAETINTPSEAAAATGLTLFTALLDPAARRSGRTVSIEPGGPEALMLHSGDALVQGKKGRPATHLIWRSGKLLASVVAAGASPRRNDRAALRFGRIEQERLAAPTPYTEAERDDSEAALDDPGLGFPVYWVGHSFAPGGGLPATQLEDAFTRYGPPGEKVALWYEAFILDAWTTASWEKFAASGLGPVNLHARCTSTEPLALEHGSALIYATYEGRFRSCPSRKPDRFYAVARIGGMVIGVNLSPCLKCRPGASGPYGSRQAIVAILRALTPRPRPVY
jgi:hypothetical protein